MNDGKQDTARKETCMKLIVYGYSDDLVEFETVDGTLVSATDESDENNDGDGSWDVAKPGSTGAEFPTDVLDTGIAVFTLGDVLEITALYNRRGCWSFAVGMIIEGTYPQWARDGGVEIEEQFRPERDTGSYSMRLTINNIPPGLAYLKRTR